MLASHLALGLVLAGAAHLLVPPAVAAGVGVRFDLADPATTPFPSDRFTVRDWSNVTFRRLNLPKPDCTVRPSDCADLEVINTLDGFSTQPRFTVPFTGPIDPASVSSKTVFLMNLGDTLTLRGLGQRVGINQVVWDPPSLTVAFESDELLNQHSRYLLVVTDGVKDARGQPIRPGRFTELVERPGGQGGSALEFLRELRDATRMRTGARDRIVAATLFTTQSISADLVKIAAQIKANVPASADLQVGQLDGNTVRAAFPVSSLASVQFVRQTGTAPTFAPPTPLVVSVLGAVGQLAYGRFGSPDYQAEPAFIPPTGTLVGQPQVRRTNELMFQLLVPAGPQPLAGWPVALFGHGGGSTFNNSGVWRIGGELARQGIATIAIHAVGNGGGPLGTVNLQLADGTRVVVPAGGRGIDLDGNGTIDPSEGGRAAAPRGLLGPRDSIRQTAIDQMQLVRQIEVGIDIDGDGRPDLDASRVYVAGQSFGTNHGMLLLALDPSVRAGVLNVAGGSGTEAVRLGAPRPVMGIGFAARVPSLINVGGITFDENIPLRDLAPVVNTVAGAFALAENIDWQEWAQQSANPVAYAPFIRRQPMHGQAAKPVIFQFAKGDLGAPNPTNSAILRAGDLADRATYYRHDLLFAANPTAPKDPHNFLTNANLALQPIGLAALRQMAVFFATHGATTIDPDGDGLLFETPIVPPLPEAVNAIP